MDHSHHGRKFLAATGLALALGLPLSAVARPPGGHGGNVEARIEQLDLAPEAQAKVDAIFDAARNQRREIKRELHTAHAEMRDLLASGDSDEATLVAQAEHISALKLEMQKQRIATHLELRSVLSTEQMERFVASLPERTARGERRFRR